MGSAPAADYGGLVGAWTLLHAQWEMADSGERFDMYGADPRGAIAFAVSGRMVALVTSAPPPSPRTDADRAALTKAMMAYSGRFRLEGPDQFITSVEVAWHPAWIGTEQARFFSIANDVLSIRSGEQTHPSFPGRRVRGILSLSSDHG